LISRNWLSVCWWITTPGQLFGEPPDLTTVQPYALQAKIARLREQRGKKSSATRSVARARRCTSMTTWFNFPEFRSWHLTTQKVRDYLRTTHETPFLSEREKHLIGLAVTMTRGCHVCTRRRIEKALADGIEDELLPRWEEKSQVG
jgi:hypothetical protein